MIWIILLLLALLLCYDMLVIEPHRLVVKRYQLTGNVKKPIRIVHFSDTHFHGNYRKRQTQTWIKAINEAQPDLVLFSGDLMDNFEKAPELAKQLPQELKQIKATLGKYAVYGNHDVGGNALSVYEKIMKEGEFHVLRNDTACFPDEGFALLGMDDANAGYEDRELTKQQLAPYQILMMHEPDMLDELDTSTIDLMLSGHTHGGQVAIPLLCRFVLPRRGQQYRKGRYQKDKTTLFVSSGLGMTALPLRFLNPPEILIYEIKPLTS